mgnify:CR=1 FL=1
MPSTQDVPSDDVPTVDTTRNGGTSPARNTDRVPVKYDGGEPATDATTPAVEPTDGTVMVVDDEAGFADAVALWLEPEYDVTVVYDGDDAIDAYGDHVDVLLLDRRMPTVSGDDVLEHVRDADGTARIAMLTASELAVADAALDFDQYLQKPVSEDDVREAVTTLKRRNAYPRALCDYLATLERLSELHATHDADRLDDEDSYAALESRLDDLRDPAENALADLPDDEEAAIRERVDEAAYPASL